MGEALAIGRSLSRPIDRRWEAFSNAGNSNAVRMVACRTYCQTSDLPTSAEATVGRLRETRERTLEAAGTAGGGTRTLVLHRRLLFCLESTICSRKCIGRGSRRLHENRGTLQVFDSPPIQSSERNIVVKTFDRITQRPDVLAGRATIRGLRISVAHVVNLVANGMSPAQIVEELPDLEEEDVRQALVYAAALAQDESHPLRA